MIDTQALKGAMVSKGYTQEQLASAMNIAPKTLSIKFKKGVFGSDEMDLLIKLLEIKDPMSIFFCDCSNL